MTHMGSSSFLALDYVGPPKMVGFPPGVSLNPTKNGSPKHDTRTFSLRMDIYGTNVGDLTKGVRTISLNHEDSLERGPFLL